MNLKRCGMLRTALGFDAVSILSFTTVWIHFCINFWTSSSNTLSGNASKQLPFGSLKEPFLIGPWSSYFLILLLLNQGNICIILSPIIQGLYFYFKKVSPSKNCQSFWANCYTLSIQVYKCCEIFTSLSFDKWIEGYMHHPISGR